MSERRLRGRGKRVGGERVWGMSVGYMYEWDGEERECERG